MKKDNLSGKSEIEFVDVGGRKLETYFNFFNLKINDSTVERILYQRLKEERNVDKVDLSIEKFLIMTQYFLFPDGTVYGDGFADVMFSYQSDCELIYLGKIHKDYVDNPILLKHLVDTWLGITDAEGNVIEQQPLETEQEGVADSQAEEEVHLQVPNIIPVQDVQTGELEATIETDTTSTQVVVEQPPIQLEEM